MARQRINLIIVLLFAVTIVSWSLGLQADAATARFTTVVIILIAAIKVRFVMLDFMEIKTAPWQLRLFCESWIALLALIIICLHLHGTTQ